MKKIPVLMLMMAMCAVAARAAERLTDRDVKALVERVDQDRDRFQDAADDSFTKAVIRNASGETDVKRVLDDFEKTIERLKERLKPEYSASTEAAAVLRQAAGIQAAFKSQSSPKGGSEWNKLADDLTALAGVYGTQFPVPEGAAVRRIGDRELAQAAERLEGVGDRLRKALETDLKKNKAVDEPTRKSLLTQVSEWTDAAKTLRERVDDGQPSSAEADRVLKGAAALRSLVESRQSAGGRAVLDGAAPLLQTVAQAYGQKPQP